MTGWITELLGNFGWILGGGAVAALAALIIIDVPGPFKPWAIALLTAVAGFAAFKIEETNYAECKAAMAAFAEKAEAAKIAALEQAKKNSDAALAELQIRLDAQGDIVTTFSQRIAADVANKNCPPSPAAIDASRGVQRLVGPRPIEAPAKPGPAPRLPTSLFGK